MKAGSDQRWVCTACGKFTELGGDALDLHDTSCVHYAALCHGTREPGQPWKAVPTDAVAWHDDEEGEPTT